MIQKMFTKKEEQILADFHNALAKNGLKLQWQAGEWALYMGRPYIYLGKNKWMEVETGIDFVGAPSPRFLYIPVLQEDWFNLTRAMFGKDNLRVLKDMIDKCDIYENPIARLVSRILFIMNIAGLMPDKRSKHEGNLVTDIPKKSVLVPGEE